MSLGSADRLEQLRLTALGPSADEGLDRFARLVQRLLVVPVALVSLVDAERQHFPGQVGLPGDDAESRETPLTHSLCQHVVLSGQPLVVRDTREDPLLAGNLAVQDLSAGAYAGMPLTDSAGVVLGALCAISDEPRTWTEADLVCLADLAAACSSELRLRLAARTAQTALARVALLGEVTRAVGTTLDAEDAVERLVRLVVPSLADWATAGLVDDAGRVWLSRGRHRDNALAAQMQAFTEAQAHVMDPTAASRVVLRTEEPVVLGRGEVSGLLGVDDGSTAPALRDSYALVVPLRARGGSLGYLTMGRTAGAGVSAYGEAELHDALDIGRRTGLALDNAELYRKQRSYAEALQRHLLTRLPEPDHLHVVARYVPAVQSAQVGGDWYDAFLQPDGASMLVVGDVSGHDIDAAAMMGQVRNLVRGIAYDRDEPPAAVLTRVDRSLRGLQVDTLATMVLARIEQTEEQRLAGVRVLRWSNAGHPPPVLIHPDGTVVLLEAEEDLLIGYDPETPRQDHTVVLEPGATVLLYTDGLVERRDSPLERGLARLRRSVGALAAAPLDVLCDEVLARMLPQGAEDDVALVAVRAFDESEARPTEAGPSDDEGVADDDGPASRASAERAQPDLPDLPSDG